MAQHHNNRKPFNKTKPVEARYHRALKKMRGMRVGLDSKALQEDIMWTKKQIEDYGFRFAANAYCYPLVFELESLVDQLEQHPSTKITF